MTAVEQCARAHRGAAPYRMRGPAGPEPLCLRHAITYRRMVRTALLTALVVGTLLNLINSGPAIFSGDLEPAMAWKIPLTYGVRMSRASGA
jgi:hypothetical protein